MIDPVIDRRKKFRVWPEPKKGLPYGPNEFQRLAFIEKLDPRPHQHNLDVLLFIGAARSGKCMAKDTPIIMFDGSVKKVQNVKVGDLLMGPDSTPRNVVSLGRGREIMYKITPERGESFTCNASHILPLKRTADSSRQKRIRKDGSIYIKPPRYQGQEFINVSVREYVTWSETKKRHFRLWRPDHIDFPSSTKTLSLDPYFLGLWLGDGHSSGPIITTTDTEVIDYLQDFADKYIELTLKKVSVVNRAPDYSLTSGNTGQKVKNPIREELKTLNLINNKHIPQIYKTSSKKDRLQLLAGLLDSDGHLHKNKHYFEITQKSKKLAEDIAFLARSLGFCVTIKECEKYCTYKGEKRVGTYYRISIIGHTQNIPTKIPRKQAVAKLKQNHFNRVAFKVEELGEDDYYGFTLDGDHLFLLGDFTVSHNTATAVARVIQYLLENPGAQAVVGAQNWPLLQRTAYDEWRKRFSIRSDWDHPYVEKKPTQQRKQLQLTNGSTVWFLHFSDFKILRGIEADIIHIEEASLLPSEDSMNELIRRLSGRKGPVKQLFLTTNPEESHGWLHEKFSLEQDTPDYDGEPIPRGSKCKCHLCPNCLNFDGVEIELEDVCKVCEHKRDTACPGNQEFFRVVVSSSKQNKNLDSSYVQNMAGSMSEEYFKLYGEGVLSELRQGKIYKGFTKENKLTKVKSLNNDLPLYWSFDFNISYQCSVVCQEENDILYVLDEIVLPEAGPEHVAVEFLRRYHEYPGKVYLYGDPAAINRKMGPNDSTQYQIIYNILTNPKLANLTYSPMNVEIMVKANKKIPVVERVDATNQMLTSSDGKHKCLINPHCKYLFASLEGVRWSELPGNTRMDTNCDKNAARSPNKRAIHVVTHITDALGYLIYKRHPIIKKSTEDLFFQIPGDKTVRISPTGFSEYVPYVEPPDATSNIKKIQASESFLDFLRKINSEYDQNDFGNISGFFG